jgi:hypothetical protein
MRWQEDAGRWGVPWADFMVFPSKEEAIDHGGRAQSQPMPYKSILGCFEKVLFDLSQISVVAVQRMSLSRRGSGAAL